VLFPPDSRQALKQGIDQMAHLLGLTLGPLSGSVLVMPTVGSVPESLQDGAVIARRVIEVPGRFANMGAMVVRHLAYHVRREVGDGSATTAVLMQAMVDEAYRNVAAGANPMMLRKGLVKALRAAVGQLRDMAQPLDDLEKVTGLATAASGHPELGKLIAEILDLVGLDGVVEVEGYAATYLDREYVPGARYNAGYASASFATDPAQRRAEIDRPALVVTDAWVDSTADAVALLDCARRAGAPGLAIVANGFKDRAMAALLYNRKTAEFPSLALKAPGMGEENRELLQDIAVLTGARPLMRDLGASLAAVRPQDLGGARRVDATPDHFTIVGAKGNPRAVHGRAQSIRRALAGVDAGPERQRMWLRIGRLSGGIAILKVGANTQRGRDELKQSALDAIEAVRAALEEGVAPGGGVAYINCAPAIEALQLSGDETVGAQILARALRAPLEVIARNSGREASTVLAQVERQPVGVGLDVLSGELVDTMAVGIVDPVKVLRRALEAAVSGAVMAVTTDVLAWRSPRGKWDFSDEP
jgi:chaperonin GroEL